MKTAKMLTRCWCCAVWKKFKGEIWLNINKGITCFIIFLSSALQNIGCLALELTGNLSSGSLEAWTTTEPVLQDPWNKIIATLFPFKEPWERPHWADGETSDYKEPQRHTSHLKHLRCSPCFLLSASWKQGEYSTGKGQFSGRFSYRMGSDFFIFLLQDSFRSNGYIPLFGFQMIINDSKTEVLTSQLFFSHHDLFRLQKG